MSPRSGTSSQLMQRRKVDFPEPDGPMMQTTSPLATLNETLKKFREGFAVEEEKGLAE